MMAQTGLACMDCRRRGWLLTQLGGTLDWCSRERSRLLAALELEDDELIQALGGRGRAQLRARYEAFEPPAASQPSGIEEICRHDRRYPQALRGAGYPRMLSVAGGASRLLALCRAPTVGVIGSRMASDYGREMARCLARGLAIGGVTVIGAWEDGIATAAHDGALQAPAGSLAVLGGGLDTATPARRRALLRRLERTGCAVAELPCGCSGRRWGRIAGERVVAALAAVTVVVEAREDEAELAGARLAQSLGRVVAAIPGRVTSPLSGGTNALLKEGAELVRDPADVLELLYAIGASPAPALPALETRARLEPRLRALLERVGAGCETLESLVASDGEDVLMALSELELLGLLRRGDGGRYVLTSALPASAPATHASPTSPAGGAPGTRCR